LSQWLKLGEVGFRVGIKKPPKNKTKKPHLKNKNKTLKKPT